MGSHYDSGKGIYVDDDTGDEVGPSPTYPGPGGITTPPPPTPVPPPPPPAGSIVTDDDKKWLDDTYQKMFGRAPTAAEAADLQRMHDIHGSDASSYRDYYASQVLGPRSNNIGGTGQQGTAINYGNYNPRTGQGSPNNTNVWTPSAASGYSPEMLSQLKEWDKLYVQHLGRHIGAADVDANWDRPHNPNPPSLDAIRASILASPEYKAVMARGGPTTSGGGGGGGTGGGGNNPALFDNSGNTTLAGQNWFGDQMPGIYQPFEEEFNAPAKPQGYNDVWNRGFTAPRVTYDEQGNRQIMHGNYLADLSGGPQAQPGAAGATGTPPTANPQQTSDFESIDPGYDFRIKEAQKAMERGAAARGTLLTGGTQKAIGRDISDYASNEYNNIYNRDLGEYGTAYGIFGSERGQKQSTYADDYNKAMQEYMNRYQIGSQNQLNKIGSQRNNMLDAYGMAAQDRQMSDAETGQAFDIWNTLDTNYFNRLFSVSNSGLNAGGALGGMGSQIADYLTQLGNTRAAGTVGAANAYQTALGNVGRNVWLPSIIGSQRTSQPRT